MGFKKLHCAWEGQGRTNLIVTRGSLITKLYITKPMEFSKKCKTLTKTLTAIILHKNLSQSLRVFFLRAPFSWKLLKIGSVIVYSYVKKGPYLQVLTAAPGQPMALKIKAVYLVFY